MATAKKIQNMADFDRAITSFKRSIKANMKRALELSQFAYLHFEEHGDLNPVQKFYDAMPQNYLRKAAFKAWVMEYAPVKFDGGKFTKDKGEDANPFNHEKALAKPFWDAKPEREDVYFLNADIFKALENAVKRFHQDKMHAANAQAGETLEKVEAMIADAKMRFVEGTDTVQ